jgi:DNA adenine methylase
MRVNVPPIKSQGIKTKLVPWVKSIVPSNFDGVWIEPFMGTGAVAFNIAPTNALLCDKNPHLVNFYSSLAHGEINSGIVRDYLAAEGKSLLEKGEDHYYEVRDRFNKHHSPLDFLFLNRAEGRIQHSILQKAATFRPSIYHQDRQSGKLCGKAAAHEEFCL